MAKILCVDDSHMVRDLICSALEDAGHEVLGVDPFSLQEVLKTICSFRPGLLITDYQMPNCNGEALVKAVREHPILALTPIMVLTAHRDEDVIQRLARYGISGFLLKGDGLLKLVSQVAEVL